MRQRHGVHVQMLAICFALLGPALLVVHHCLHRLRNIFSTKLIIPCVAIFRLHYGQRFFWYLLVPPIHDQPCALAG